MQINLSNIALIFSLLASIMVPVGAYYTMKSDIKVLQTQMNLSFTAMETRMQGIQAELAEMRALHYQSASQIKENKVAIKKIDIINKKHAIELKQLDKSLAILDK